MERFIHEMFISHMLAEHLIRRDSDDEDENSDRDSDHASDHSGDEESSTHDSSDDDDSDDSDQDPNEERSNDLVNERKRCSLLTAVARGNLDKVTKFIKDGTDVNALINGIPLLHWAVMHNQPTIVTALLKAGALPNALDATSQSILQRAIVRRNLEIFRTLLEAKADIHYSGGEYNDKKESILHKAVDAGSTDMAKLLLDYGADVNAINSQGKSVLFYAAIRKKERPRVSHQEYEALLSLLISRGAKVLHDGPADENRSFETVLRYGSLQAVQLFLNNGVNLKDIRDQPLLHIALKNKNSSDVPVPNGPDVLKYLLETDLFDVEKADAEDCSPLIQAIYDCRVGSTDCPRVDLLLRYGADPNRHENRRQTPLLNAASNVQVGAMKSLLEFGAHLDTEICKTILADIRFWKHRGELSPSRVEDLSLKTYEILIKHIALRESLDWKEIPDIFEILDLHPRGHDYYKSCKDELALLKNFIVYKSLNLYTILTGINIYRHVDNKHVIKAFKDQDIIKKFPKYGGQTGRRLVRLREKHKLMLQAMRGLGRVLKYDVNALHLVVYNVLGRLEKSDLRNLSRV